MRGFHQHPSRQLHRQVPLGNLRRVHRSVDELRIPSGRGGHLGGAVPERAEQRQLLGGLPALPRRARRGQHDRTGGVARGVVVGGLSGEHGRHQRQVTRQDSVEQPAVAPAGALDHPVGRHVLGDGGHQPVHPLRVPGVLGAHREFGLEAEHHALAVGVLGTNQGPGLDPVEHQVGLRIDEGLVDPVGHLLGPAQPVAVPGQEDGRRPVRRRVEELVLLAPRDSAAVLGHPGRDELLGQRLQRLGPFDTGDPAGPLQRERQPGHVVVIVVGPATDVAQPVPADLAGDLLLPHLGRVAPLRIHEVVQQMGLPPVVPGAETAVAGGGGPGHHPELCPGQPPQPLEMPPGDRGFGAGGAVGPQLIHLSILPHQLPETL